MTFHFSSSAFAEGMPIPKEHTADGPNGSPALAWSDPPPGTVAFALLCDDPDAPRGNWVHWVLFNLPGDMRNLPAGITSAAPTGAEHGTNDFGKPGYGGPAPPRGKPHRYFFKIYALDAALTLRAGATKDQLHAAMHGHILGEGTLMGTYQR